ncbi:hypothetical protein KIL84_004330 [Mauremys mutica]|uniref:Uncharacterized protein n=1 Tax=Mauremys mutica TaxID=74926 RepID=A0A9D3XMV3_9SAUR|nr:hypothetical protein KIL84_004330 [Mauremys mutica]
MHQPGLPLPKLRAAAGGASGGGFGGGGGSASPRWTTRREKMERRKSILLPGGEERKRHLHPGTRIHPGGKKDTTFLEQKSVKKGAPTTGIHIPEKGGWEL